MTESILNDMEIVAACTGVIPAGVGEEEARRRAELYNCYYAYLPSTSDERRWTWKLLFTEEQKRRFQGGTHLIRSYEERYIPERLRAP